MFPPKEWLTVDGYDMQFGTNVLGMTITFLLLQDSNLSAGHFYFTKLLLPTLIATAKSAPDGKARVITTSSSAHILKGLTFSAFEDSPARGKMSTTDLYGQSKTASRLCDFASSSPDSPTGQRRTSIRTRKALQFRGHRFHTSEPR